MPAGDHLSVCSEAVPAVAYFCPLINDAAAVVQEEIPAVVYLTPALSHGAVSLKIVIYRRAVIRKLKPACLKLSAGRVKIVPFI